MGPNPRWIRLLILLMEEILHQLICSLSHYLQGLCIPGGAGFLPSTVGYLQFLQYHPLLLPVVLFRDICSLTSQTEGAPTLYSLEHPWNCHFLPPQKNDDFMGSSKTSLPTWNLGNFICHLATKLINSTMPGRSHQDVPHRTLLETPGRVETPACGLTDHRLLPKPKCGM